MWWLVFSPFLLLSLMCCKKGESSKSNSKARPIPSDLLEESANPFSDKEPAGVTRSKTRTPGRSTAGTPSAYSLEYDEAAMKKKLKVLAAQLRARDDAREEPEIKKKPGKVRKLREPLKSTEDQENTRQTAQFTQQTSFNTAQNSCTRSMVTAPMKTPRNSAEKDKGSAEKTKTRSVTGTTGNLTGNLTGTSAMSMTAGFHGEKTGNSHLAVV